ncbi:MAG: hypothetical protein EZS28_029698 [Streblomastix strix]|uniref:Uncharacterized protein n=1 Tax=Streblomastix strix TaxID=222440 RepID=A0A5J4UVR7_9EUKA|nr:MAG: hypothetical protein EZS28_029698 [Streblomastix strix]
MQGKHDNSTNKHDKTRKLIENAVIFSNTSRVQQSDFEITTPTTLEGRSISGFCRHVINENCRFYRRTGPGTEEAGYATRNGSDQEQIRDNITRTDS